MRKVKVDEFNEEIVLLEPADNRIKRVIKSPLLFIFWSIVGSLVRLFKIKIFEGFVVVYIPYNVIAKYRLINRYEAGNIDYKSDVKNEFRKLNLIDKLIIKIDEWAFPYTLYFDKELNSHRTVKKTLFQSKVYIDLFYGSASAEFTLGYQFVGRQTRRKNLENKKVFGDLPVDREKYRTTPRLLGYEDIDFDLLEEIPENGILHEGGNSDIHYKHYQQGK